MHRDRIARAARRWVAPCLLASAAAIAAPQTDPIELPAQPSVLAPRSMLVTVTRTPGGAWVAVGRRGNILLSKDATNWASAAVPASVDLTSVCFASATHGWAVGHGGVIVATTDGGRTWAKQLDGRQAAKLLVEHHRAAGDAAALADAERFLEDGPGRPFLDVWFGDERNGLAVGAFNLVFATQDGGATWTPQPERLPNPNGLHLYAVRQIGGSLYVAGEQGFLARLDAATGRFEPVKTPYKGSFFGLAGKDRLLVLFGLQGNVWRSMDGGASWGKVDVGLSGTIASGSVLDDGRLVLASQDGRLVVGAADGERFTLIQPRAAGGLYGLAPADGGRVVTVGARGVGSERLP